MDIPPSLILGIEGSLDASGSWRVLSPSVGCGSSLPLAPLAESFELAAAPGWSVDIADAAWMVGRGIKALPELMNRATSSDNKRWYLRESCDRRAGHWGAMMQGADEKYFMVLKCETGCDGDGQVRCVMMAVVEKVSRSKTTADKAR